MDKWSLQKPFEDRNQSQSVCVCVHVGNVKEKEQVLLILSICGERTRVLMKGDRRTTLTITDARVSRPVSSDG